jgi:SAM-dependent methyltransferase
MDDFYGEDLASVHAEAFEALAASAADSLLEALGPDGAGRRVLDLGCGAGPLGRRLRAHGFATWGLDLSPALIALARERMPDAEFHCGSILEAPLPAPAAAVAAIGEVLNYATADRPDGLARVFQRVFDALAPGGLFLFDLAAPGRAGAGRGFSEGDTWAVGVVATEADNLLLRRITTFRDAGEGAWTRSSEEHRLRLWPPAEVTQRLTACGFQVQALPGYGAMPMPPSLHAYLATRPA